MEGRTATDGKAPPEEPEEGVMMPRLKDSGLVTGTPDKDYNLISFTETCLRNALRLETFIEDARQAGDDEVAELFAHAQLHSVRGAERGKALLSVRLA